MTLQLLVAFFHLLTLGIGFYSIWSRANALKALKDNSGLPAVFTADNFWGLAAGLWIVTGLWRAFGGLEKGSTYYLHNTAFLIKMGLFLLVFILEVKPMITLIQWRTKLKKGETIDFSPALSIARISHIQLGLLAFIILFAAAVARGVWY